MFTIWKKDNARAPWRAKLRISLLSSQHGSSQASRASAVRIARLLFLLLVLWIRPHQSSAQTPSQKPPISDQQLRTAFLNESAPELLNKYFQMPPYPLFVILRLIDLEDPVAVPRLEEAFARETQNPNREFIAAALVNLGSKKQESFNYLACRAIAAITSGPPFPVRFGTNPLPGAMLPPVTSDFTSWVRRHGLTANSAMQKAAFDDPAAVQALGEAADRRSRSILLRGLNSPNILVVFESSLGLARLDDRQSIPEIIAAAQHFRSPKERRMIAKSLLYFDSSKAQFAAERLIRDPALVRRWREEVSRRGTKMAMRDNGD